MSILVSLKTEYRLSRCFVCVGGGGGGWGEGVVSNLADYTDEFEET